jgi:hypothetical protein
MNWYRKVKIAIPLPSVVEDIPSNNESGYGLRDVDISMPEDVAKEEAQRFNKRMPYLGSGSYGVAFGVGAGMAVKYTVDKYEAQCATRLMEIQKEIGSSLAGIVRIYDVRELKVNPDVKQEEGFVREKKLFAITLERVEHLSPGEDDAYQVLRKMQTSFGFDPTTMAYEEFIQAGRREEFGVEMDCVTEHYFNKYVRFMASIHEIGSSHDAHHKNIGKRINGEWVLLDIGGLCY